MLIITELLNSVASNCANKSVAKLSEVQDQLRYYSYLVHIAILHYVVQFIWPYIDR